MAEIFISYKSERRRAAEHLAAVMERHGYSVWFDYGLIKGDDFDFQLDRHLRAAKAVVVLWCSRSVDSHWVSREANLAAKLKTLLPAMIEECELKLAHHTADYVDLRAWDGSPRSDTLDPLFRELTRLVGRPPQVDWTKLTEYEQSWRMFGAPTLAAFALGQPFKRPEPVGSLPIALPPVGQSVVPYSFYEIAAKEWPAVRDSADPRRLRRFEEHFAGTWFAAEARDLREAIEPERKIKEAETTRDAVEQESRPPVMQEGTIDRLTDRGYGFIKPEDGKADLFFHAKELQDVRFDDLREGDKMVFEVGGNLKGLYAVRVNRA